LKKEMKADLETMPGSAGSLTDGGSGLSFAGPV
jgi:hypothetical protein